MQMHTKYSISHNDDDATISPPQDRKDSSKPGKPFKIEFWLFLYSVVQKCSAASLSTMPGVERTWEAPAFTKRCGRATSTCFDLDWIISVDSWWPLRWQFLKYFQQVAERDKQCERTFLTFPFQGSDGNTLLESPVPWALLRRMWDSPWWPV